MLNTASCSVPKIGNFQLALAAVHNSSEREDHSSAFSQTDSAGVLSPTSLTEANLVAALHSAHSETSSARADSLASSSQETSVGTLPIASTETVSASATLQLPSSTKDISTASPKTVSVQPVSQTSSPSSGSGSISVSATPRGSSGIAALQAQTFFGAYRVSAKNSGSVPLTPGPEPEPLSGNDIPGIKDVRKLLYFEPLVPQQAPQAQVPEKQTSCAKESYKDYVQTAWKNDFPRHAEQSSEFDFIVNVLGGFALTLAKNILKACTQGFFHFLEESCHYLHDRAVEKGSSVGTLIAGLGWNFFYGLRIIARAAFSPLDSLEAAMQNTGWKKVASVAGSLLLTGAVWAAVGFFAAPLVIAQKAVWFGIEVTKLMVAAAIPVVGTIAFALHRVAKAASNLINRCWQWLTVKDEEEKEAPRRDSTVNTGQQVKANQDLLTRERSLSVGKTPLQTSGTKPESLYGGSGSSSSRFDEKLTFVVTNSSSQTASQFSMVAGTNVTTQSFPSSQESGSSQPISSDLGAENMQETLSNVPEVDEKSLSATSTRSPSPGVQAPEPEQETEQETEQLNMSPVTQPSQVLAQFRVGVLNRPDNKSDSFCVAIKGQHRKNASVPPSYRYFPPVDQPVTSAENTQSDQFPTRMSNLGCPT